MTSLAAQRAFAAARYGRKLDPIPEERPYAELAIGVIRQAMLDGLGLFQGCRWPQEREAAQQDALRFLSPDDGYLRWWCSVAEASPEALCNAWDYLQHSPEAQERLRRSNVGQDLAPKPEQLPPPRLVPVTHCPDCGKPKKTPASERCKRCAQRFRMAGSKSRKQKKAS
jgi:hypothetical protein